MSSNKKGYRALRTQRAFLQMTAADVVSRFGDSLDAIAYSLMMYAVTGSASLMALLLGVNYLPTILLQPLSGVWADRVNKRRMMALCDLGRGTVVLLTAALYAASRLTPALLAVFTVTNSCLEALRAPAGAAILPELLDEDKYTLGAALSGSLCRAAEIVGLCVAGGIVALIGAGGALMIDAATFFFSALLVSRLRVEEAPGGARTTLRDVREGFASGIRYALSGNRFLLVLLCIGAMMNFVMVPLNVLGTPYVMDSLGAGPATLSAVQLALVAGMALGAFATPKLRLRGRTLFLLAGLLCAASLAALGLAPAVPRYAARVGVAVLLLLCLGAGVGVESVLFSSAFMHNVPAEMMGRASGLSNAVLCAAMPLGAFLCSAAARFLRVETIVLLAGALSLLLYLLLYRVGSLDRLGEGAQAEDAPQAPETSDFS